MDDWELLAAFRDHQQQRNLSPTTIGAYASLHQSWALWLADHDSDLAGADRENVLGFLATRRLTARGRYSYLSRLAVLHRWLNTEGHTAADPTGRIPRPQLPALVPRPIRTVELERALATAAPRTRAMMSLAAFCGLRCKEIAGLKVEDLSDGWLVVTSPKGCRERQVPLHPEAERQLHVLGLPSSGYVFPWWDRPDRHVEACWVSHEINTHLHELGISATAHQLRHWYACEVYKVGHDLRLTQELLGHRSPSTTAGYVQVGAVEMAATVRQLGEKGRRHVRTPKVARHGHACRDGRTRGLW